MMPSGSSALKTRAARKIAGFDVRRHTQDGVTSEAVFSRCGSYRYRLTRVWQPAASRVAFVMLNPSVACEKRNDPTVARCEARARAAGYGAFAVVNLFAWRDTDPAALRRAKAPVGPENDAMLIETGHWAHRVIAAWGIHGAHRGRGAVVAEMLRDAGVDLFHLGLTKAGHPRHPLYLPYGCALQPWHATD